MNKTILLVMVCFVLASAFLVIADENDTDVNASDQNNSVGPGALKNMTFWACVSDAAKAKNDCYDVSKNATAACANASGADKAAGKACQQAGKSSKTSCKTSFKAVKNECNKIKHTYWEGFKALFK